MPPQTELVPYLGSLLLPRAFEVTVKDPELPYDVHLSVKVADGVPRVVKLTCSQRRAGPEVDGRGLRSIPVQELLAAAVKERARGAGKRRSRPLVDGSLPPSAVLADRQRQPMTDELLMEVATVYRSAEPLGKPVEMVAEYFSSEERRIPRNTVRRWVMEARNRGFLEPSKQGESRRANQKND